MQILVVDDDPIARTVISSLLRVLGHEVSEACDGNAAWEMMQQKRYPIIVIDWIMPGLSGVDLCRKIRAESNDNYVYVILCTANGDKADLVNGMDAGADDFLVKPVSPEELRVRVRAGERIAKLEQRLADRNRELQRSNEQLQHAYEVIEEDVRAAAWVQENLLPSPAANMLGVACKWRFRPSRYVGGDIFNCFAVDERHVGFYLLDVAGHGVPAAMSSVALSMILSPDGTHGGPLKKYEAQSERYIAAQPSEVIAELNRRFQASVNGHFAMSYGLLNLETSLLRLAQAGNPNPVFIQSGGDIRTLTDGGMPVGLWPDIHIDIVEVPFEPGDRLVLYSDGVPECMNHREEEFGDERLVDCLAGAAREPMDLMLNNLERQLERWRGSSDFDDDVSLLAVELTGQEMK